MLVITLGEALSVSVECLYRLRVYWENLSEGPVVLVGSFGQWTIQTQELGEKMPYMQRILSWADVEGKDKGLFFFDVDSKGLSLPPNQLSEKARGQIAKESLEALRDLWPKGRLAVVTCPIDKYACAQAGFSYPGQTEFFCDLWQEKGIMILAGTKLRVALATNHVRLSDVTPLITEQRIMEKLQKLEESLQEILRIPRPRIAVAALNPHAGDQGLFGDEDQRIVAPAIARMRDRGMDVVGPKAADTLFFQAWQGAYDAVLAMYHDQGLGPLKALHFYDAVNITGGLPHLRVSPDHGPAREIYGRNEAKEDSFRLSLEHAHRYLGW